MLGFKLINTQLKIIMLPKFLGSGVLTYTPNYVDKVISLVSNEKWLFHNLNLENESNLYDPAIYISAKQIYNRKYTIVLDTNIYDFLLKSINNPSNEKHRNAVALLIFCQLSEIEIDPFFAVHEKLENENLDSSLDSLDKFNKINNSNTEMLINYTLKNINDIVLNEGVFLLRGAIRDELLMYRKPDEWKSLYLIMLKIINIKYDNSITPNNKLKEFLNWLVKEFRMSVPGIVYALVLFGLKPIRRMMKYKPDDAREDKKKNVNNMTWDLFIIRHFFKKWEVKKDGEEFIFASDDNAFGNVLNLAINIYKEQNFNLCEKQGFINSSDKEILNLLFIKACGKNRVYRNSELTPEDRFRYRDNLIQHYERTMGIID
jgi:hypothetical protein